MGHVMRIFNLRSMLDRFKARRRRSPNHRWDTYEKFIADLCVVVRDD